MKVASQSYRGIDFVCISDLPPAQQEALLKSPQTPERIKILINGKVVDQCLYYKDYEYWFNRVFSRERQLVTPNTPDPAVSVQLSLSN